MEVAAAEIVVLRAGALSVHVGLDPLTIAVERAGAVVVGPLSPWSCDGTVHDQFIQLTEGVIASEERGARVPIGATAVTATDDARVRVAGADVAATISLDADAVGIEIEWDGAPLRTGVSWPSAPGEHLTGLGARHGLAFDQAGRTVVLGADRRYTGPDCPQEMLDTGGIPQGDYAPAPWLLSSGPWALHLDTHGPGAELDLGTEISVSARAAAGPLRLRFLLQGSPASRLRAYLRATGMPALLPEWAYGHWKSRDVYEHQDDVLDDFHGYERHDLPLDAIVIDSPWETQYNTWEFNPHQFPDAGGMVRRMRRAGVRTVVWVTPWVNLDSSVGQRPPDAESERLHREPAPNYAPGAAAGHFIKTPEGKPFVARWWMGTGSPVDFTSPAADEWWRELARPVLELGVEGIKADDGEGYYFPPEARFADGRTGADAAWAYGGLYRRSMQRALDDAHAGEGVVFGRSGWTGQQATGITWGGDQGSDFWSLRTLVTATLTAAASGFSNWSHDVGGYLGERLVDRCPKELLLRWVQLGCFTPLMQAHGRFQQEAWTYDAETLEIYRRYVVLHERLVPYIRAAAVTAARSGLPIVRPLCLTDPNDDRGWTLPDAFGFGPSLWVAPVLEDGARARSVYLPRGDWIDYWTERRVEGGRELEAPAPLDRIPAWVRAGSLLVTYPAGHVAQGLGDVADADRPLEATLWGEPRLGRASARLADGTRVSWRHGAWSAEPRREMSFRVAGEG